MSTSPTAGAAPNVPEYSVGELSNAIRKTLETRFDHVRVRGEITEFMAARSGHLYMSLKDEAAKVKAVMWKGTTSRLSFRPEDGLEVVVTGKLTTYGPRSEYQLVIESMEPAGAGALMALLEERRKKLAAEGLFDADRKRPIPYLPTVIGVVTSPTGAVIRDILHRLADRFPRHVLVWPVLVQGPDAAGQVAAAIDGFNALVPGGAVPRPDVLIVARGGGSLEDLWAFNEEIVVRAAAASAIPLISAIGHETDTTLIDFAADRRAPTPTAAAELAVPVRVELLARVTDLSGRLIAISQRVVASRRDMLTALARGLRHPRDVLGAKEQRLDDLAARLGPALISTTRHHRELLVGVIARMRRPRDVLEGKAQRLGKAVDRLTPALRSDLRQHRSTLARVAGRLQVGPVRRGIAVGQERLDRAAGRLLPVMRRCITDLERALQGCGKLLESLSYTSVLDRGFAVVRRRDGATVTSAAELKAGTAIDIELRDGHTPATVDGSRPARRVAAEAEKQGRLI